jgi:hypothetical protein
MNNTFHGFYGTQVFITMFTKPHHRFLSNPYSIILYIIHFNTSFTSMSRSPTRPLCISRLSHAYYTSTCLNQFDLITLIIFYEHDKTRRFSLRKICSWPWWWNLRNVCLFMSRVSSGSIVSDYGLDDRAIGVRSRAGAEDFSSILCVQTGSGAHPASCKMGTGGPFPGGKARPGCDADHSPPSSA